MVNPYQPSTQPATPTLSTQVRNRWIVRSLVGAAIATSGVMLLLLREAIERTFYWGGGNTVTGETDAELLFYAMLTNPVWHQPVTQTAIVISPAFILCLLWARRHFS
jgi:hypothetical protein